MKLKNIITLFLALLCMSFAASPATAPAQPSGPQKFSTMAHLPSGVGRRMAGAGGTFNVDIYIESYSSDEQVKALGAMLIEGGSDAVLKALEKMPSVGKITLTGRLGFYDLKFIRSRQMENGRRLIAVRIVRSAASRLFTARVRRTTPTGSSNWNSNPIRKEKEKREPEH
jgi:hypothetical protein